jgi:dTMP kinase
MKQGKLIVFEGISGTGKETQAKLLKTALAKRGIKSSIVYHPTPELKAILSTWRKERNIDHISEVYFLLADRADRVRQVMLPALSRGEWVISLRSWVSALVYQGTNEDERNWIAHEFSHVEPQADTLFFFTIAPKVALARIMKRNRETGEALGKFETLEKLTEKRDAYREVLSQVPHKKVDAALSIEAIHAQIKTFLGI